MIKILFSLFLPLALAQLAYADTVYLNNDRSIEGIVKSDNGKSVELEVGVDSSVTFLKAEIKNIIKSSESDSSILRQKWEKDRLELNEKIARLKEEQEKEPRAINFSHGLQGIVVTVILEDKVSARMVLDTGASLVMISKNVAQELGINLAGAKPDLKAQVADGRQVSVKRIIIGTMEVQGVVAKEVEAAVLLDDTGNLGFGDGLLGMSFLKRFNFKVDQKDKKLTLEKL